MDESAISSRYAKALFELAKEQKNILDKVKNDMEIVYKTCQIKETSDFLHNPTIVYEKKAHILQLIFERKINALTLSFIRLVTKAKREFLLPDMARNFIYRYKKEKNLKTVHLTIADTVDKHAEEKLLSILSDSLQSNVELQKKMEKSLIGGFVIRIDDLQYDVSVKNQLRITKKALLNTN